MIPVTIPVRELHGGPMDGTRRHIPDTVTQVVFESNVAANRDAGLGHQYVRYVEGLWHPKQADGFCWNGLVKLQTGERVQPLRIGVRE